MTIAYAVAKQRSSSEKGAASAFADALAELFGGAAGNALYGNLDALRKRFL